MADTKLQRLWAEVRQGFERGIALLPARALETAEGVWLAEWLDHNELELALDELELLGGANAVPPAFWQALVVAAERMGLDEHRSRLAARCR